MDPLPTVKPGLDTSRSEKSQIVSGSRKDPQDSGPSADPAILFNGDGSTERRTLAALALSWINGQGSRQKLDVRPDNGAGSNGSNARVLEYAVAVDEHVVSDLNVVAVIADERRLDHHVHAHVTGRDLRRVDGRWRRRRRIAGLDHVAK